ncbi:hypothetical protein IWZ00DRAFT_340804 [Phyllosticta capitalensis]
MIIFPPCRYHYYHHYYCIHTYPIDSLVARVAARCVRIAWAFFFFFIFFFFSFSERTGLGWVGFGLFVCFSSILFDYPSTYVAS